MPRTPSPPVPTPQNSIQPTLLQWHASRHDRATAASPAAPEAFTATPSNPPGLYIDLNKPMLKQIHKKAVIKVRRIMFTETAVPSSRTERHAVVRRAIDKARESVLGNRTFDLRHRAVRTNKNYRVTCAKTKSRQQDYRHNVEDPRSLSPVCRTYGRTRLQPTPRYTRRCRRGSIQAQHGRGAPRRPKRLHVFTS